MSKTNLAANLPATESSLHRENLEFLKGLPAVIIGFIVALALFLMPIYIDLEIKHVFNAAKELLFGKLVAAAGMAWVIHVLLRGTLPVPLSKPAYFLTAVIVWMFVSILWSQSAHLSIREFGTQFSCFVFFMMILTVIRDEKWIQAIISTTIIAALLATIYGLFQYYDIDDKYFPIQAEQTVMETPIGKITVRAGESGMSYFLPFKGSAEFFQSILLPQKPEETWKDYSFMGHRNYFSGYLVLIIPLVLVRMIRKLQILSPVFLDWLKSMFYSTAQGGAPFVRQAIFAGTGMALVWESLLLAFYGIVLVAMMNAVLLTQTRGAILGMTVSFSFLILCSLLLANQDRKKQVILSIAGSLAVTLLPLGFMFLFKAPWILTPVLICAPFVFFLLIFFFRHIVSRLVLIFIFMIAVGGIFKVMTAPKQSETVRGHISTMERLSNTADWRGSEHQRTLIYSTTLRMITDDLPTLLFGKGYGTFGIHYMLYQVQLFLDTEVSGKFLWDTNKSIYAHNEYIHFWSEIGLVGISLLFAFWFFYIRRILFGIKRLYRDEYQENPLKVLTTMALLAATIGTLTHCVFTFDLHLMYSMSTFHAWAAFALILVGVPIREIDFSSSRVIRGILALVFFGLCWYCYAGFANYHYDNQYTNFILKGAALICLAGGFLMLLAALGGLAQQALGQATRACLGVGGFIAMCCILVRLTDLYWSDWYWRLAFAQFSQRNWSAAFDNYQRALQRDSTLGELLFDFGRAMMDSNNDPRIPKSEIDKFNILTIKRNLNMGTMYQRPDASGKMPDNASEELTDKNLSNNFIAISSFLEATHNFTDPANFHNIALCFYKEGQAQNNQVLLKKSEDYYQKAIDLNPIYAQSLSNLGYLKALRGETEEALSMLERAARLEDGKTATTYVGLGLIYYQKQEFDKALNAYLELEKVSPGVDTLVKIASLYRQNYIRFMQGGSKITTDEARISLLQAENYFLKAAEQEPDETTKARINQEGLQLKVQRLSEESQKPAQADTAVLDLALSLVKLGTLKTDVPDKEKLLTRGIQILNQVISLQPANAEARLTLCKAYEEVGDLEKLKEAYDNVLKVLSPNHPEYGAVRRKLQMFSGN